MIEVRLFATLREGREKIIMLESDKFETVSKVLEHFNIEQEEIAICLINGMHKTVGDSIKDGDILALFPPVGGG